MSSAVIHSLPNFRVGIRYRRGRSRRCGRHSGRRGAWMKEFDPFRLDTGNECLWRRDEQGAEERILIKAKSVCHSPATWWNMRDAWPLRSNF